MNEESKYHESVMIREVMTAFKLNTDMSSQRDVIENLHVKNQAKYIDATLGTGGHSLEILKAGGEVLGIEMDPEMLEIAKERLKNKVKLVLGNFVDIDKLAKENGFDKVSGIIFDLGVSNIHLTSDSRGFSFSDPNLPLDMRLNPEAQGVRASDLLNALREDQLIELFAVTMEGGAARWLTKRVIEGRPFATVGDFLKVCEGLRGKPGLSPATLPFLAVRIAVNSELDNLRQALPKAFSLLISGGRMIVVSFHSGEDKIAKEFFKNALVLPGEEEVRRNPRARSAKMRVYEKKE